MFTEYLSEVYLFVLIVACVFQDSGSGAVEVPRFVEQRLCPRAEWMHVSDVVDGENKRLWRAVVGHANATMAETLVELERVFHTFYMLNSSFSSNLNTTTQSTLYNNNFTLALEIRTPLNEDDLVKIEGFCRDKLPNNTSEGKQIIHSVDLNLNLSYNLNYNISAQLPCLMSKTPAANFKLTYLRVRF